MEGIKAYKLYRSIKLHFNDEKFDVFKAKGNVRISHERFNLRNDRFIFERLGRLYTDKEYIQYISSNFMYGNESVIYDHKTGELNYLEYLKRRQSITRVFENDLDFLAANSCFSSQDILQYVLCGKVTVETFRILDDLDHIIERIPSTVGLILQRDILRIKKSKGFVKYDSQKALVKFNNFKEEISSNHV